MGRGIYSISIVLMFLVHYISGCSVLEYGARAVETGDEFDSDERKVHYSDVVLYGEPKMQVQGDYPYKDIEGVSTFEFKVKCVYKNKNGKKIPETIKIAGIGNEQGQIKGCPPAPLGNGKSSIVMFLKRTKKPDVFEVEFGPNSGGIEIVLDDLSVVCNLTLQMFSDGSECEDFEPLPAGDCVSYKPKKIKRPDVEPEPEPESEEEKPEPEPKDENNPDDTVVDIEATEDGKNNQSDQGYDTKPDKDKNTGTVGGSTGDNENGSSTIVATTLLVTLVTVLLTIVV